MKMLQTLRQASSKPIRYEIVSCVFADGKKVPGMWNGHCWWSACGEIAPVRWHR